MNMTNTHYSLSLLLFSINNNRKSSSLKKSHRRNVSVNARLVGNAAPHFEGEAVIDQEFETISLDQYKGKKYVVLFFYPLDFTFVCPTEITAFSDRYEEFSKLDCEIIGCSVDSKYSHLAWIQTERNEGGLGDIEYPLLSDLKRQAVHAYDVYDENSGEALRGLFIIDKEGIIQHATINNAPWLETGGWSHEGRREGVEGVFLQALTTKKGEVPKLENSRHTKFFSLTHRKYSVRYNNNGNNNN